MRFGEKAALSLRVRKGEDVLRLATRVVEGYAGLREKKASSGKAL